jgi:hypothetical protein
LSKGKLLLCSIFMLFILLTVIIVLTISMQYVEQFYDKTIDAKAETPSLSPRVNNTGTNETGILGYGPPKPYLTLSGTNYIEISNNGSLQLTKFTLSAWFRSSMNIPFDKSMLIVNKGDLGAEELGDNINYGIWMDSSERIEAGFESRDATDYIVRGPAPYRDYQWHHAAATYDGTTLRLYIDGLPVRNMITHGASPDITNTEPLRIGAENLIVETKPREGFIGLADEIRVWNRALTDAEIEDGYRNGVFNTTGQVLYLPFG